MFFFKKVHIKFNINPATQHERRQADIQTPRRPNPVSRRGTAGDVCKQNVGDGEFQLQPIIAGPKRKRIRGELQRRMLVARYGAVTDPGLYLLPALPILDPPSGDDISSLQVSPTGMAFGNNAIERDGERLQAMCDEKPIYCRPAVVYSVNRLNCRCRIISSDHHRISLSFYLKT